MNCINRYTFLFMLLFSLFHCKAFLF